MPIKWSAVKVSEAMDEVEHQVSLAEAFLTEAKTKATEARSITNLPQYVDDHLIRVISQIERIDNVNDAITSVRLSIPKGAIEAERKSLKYGNKQSLM